LITKLFDNFKQVNNGLFGKVKEKKRKKKTYRTEKKIKKKNASAFVNLCLKVVMPENRASEFRDLLVLFGGINFESLLGSPCVRELGGGRHFSKSRGICRSVEKAAASLLTYSQQCLLS